MEKKYFIFNIKKINFLIKFFVALFIFLSTNFVFASETDGTINSTYKHAWGENIGWVNFGCDNCSVHVTDSGLSGYAWSKQFGWINLNPANPTFSTSVGVKNTSEGVLSGNAWGSNLGWINFNGVVINSNGDFSGFATIKNDNSRINFNCSGGTNSCSVADFKVNTDWRPASSRQAVNIVASTGSNHFIQIPKVDPVLPIEIPIYPSLEFKLTDKIAKVFNDASLSILNLFRSNKQKDSDIVHVPKVAPLALNTRWDLLPTKKINDFVFAPLPYQIRNLAAKFPEIDRTLKRVGVEKFSDIDKLTGVNLNVPGLAVLLDKTIKNVGVEELKKLEPIDNVSLNIPGMANMDKNLATNIGVGQISLIKGLPINSFSLKAKQNLPSEFVFARADKELVDLNVAMSISEKGDVSQRIASLPGQILKLVVKPISRARSVEGYFVFKSATPSVAKNTISRESLFASALFSMNGVVKNAADMPPVEKKLVLSTFEYTDPDHDGIYTADVMSPVVPGEYEVVTVIDYVDPELGIRKMSMITVIDPEGYIYEKNDGKETRIPKAVISLYVQDGLSGKYVLWNANEYQQKNPQTTDIRGTYSFLVPEGQYYFQVEAPGYKSYKGDIFTVSAGGGVHENIELKSSKNLLNQIDYKTILLVVVLLLLMYNLFRNSLRPKV